jgi:hypothetical protein
MKYTRLAFSLAGALGCLTIAGCGVEQDGAADDAINTTPASLSEGQAQLDKIDRIMDQSGSTEALVEKERLIRGRMDQLSGLVDSIEVAPDHSINFFVSPSGDAFVGERMKIGMVSAMTGVSAESIESIYHRLAPGRAVPAGLTRTATIQLAETPPAPAAADDIATVSSALTDSAGDDQWFRDNRCPSGNVKSFCAVHLTGSRFSEATSDHSQVSGAFTRGTGSINLNWGPGGGAAPTFTQSILPGELHFFWWVGPWKDVKDSGCLPWPFACGTHREAQKRFTRWAIAGSTTKTHDFGGSFYNAPLNWNSM